MRRLFAIRDARVLLLGWGLSMLGELVFMRSARARARRRAASGSR